MSRCHHAVVVKLHFVEVPLCIQGCSYKKGSQLHQRNSQGYMYTNFIQFSSQITIGLEEFIKSSNECHSVKILYYLQNLQPCSGISVQEPLQEVHLFTLYLKFVRGALFSTESSDSSCFSFCCRLCHVVSNSRCDDVDECDLETEYGFDSVVWGISVVSWSAASRWADRWEVTTLPEGWCACLKFKRTKFKWRR